MRRHATRIVAIFVALALIGCASAAVQQEVDRLNTRDRLSGEAGTAAGVRAGQWCIAHPQGCDFRPVAVGRDEQIEWVEDVRIPPYSVFVPMLVEEMRKRIRFTLADQ